jgi:hypothetical protein
VPGEKLAAPNAEGFGGAPAARFARPTGARGFTPYSAGSMVVTGAGDGVALVDGWADGWVEPC